MMTLSSPSLRRSWRRLANWPSTPSTAQLSMLRSSGENRELRSVFGVFESYIQNSLHCVVTVTWHLLLRWYLRQQRVRVRVTIGFLVRGRVMIKIRIRIGVMVTLTCSVYHWSNCRRSKYTFAVTCFLLTHQALLFFLYALKLSVEGMNLNNCIFKTHF